jgi:hypothetical protein
VPLRVVAIPSGIPELLLGVEVPSGDTAPLMSGVGLVVAGNAVGAVPQADNKAAKKMHANKTASLSVECLIVS